MKIKYLFLVISLWHFSLIFAGNINAHLKNGKPVNEGGVLLLNDTCIFKYNTPNPKRNTIGYSKLIKQMVAVTK